MTPGQVHAAAQQLFEAEQTGTQIGLLSLIHPGMTMDDAYAVQAALVAQKIASGRTIIGWKIGLTSRAMQQALNITTPDSGVLFDDMQFANGATIPTGRFIQPRVEVELAFVMKQPLAGQDTSAEDVLAATDYVAPAIEILDTRVLRKDPATGQARVITDTIADNAANAGIITGDARIDPQTTDLRWVGAILSRNGEVEETGLGAGVLNDPALSVAWLAQRLAQYDMQIDAGQTVLSGSFTRPLEAAAADIVADFGPHGTVRCHFA